MIRTMMSMAMCTLPAVSAPPMMETMDAAMRPHRRPMWSANGPPESAPIQAPKKNKALTAPRMSFVYFAPGPVVERLKYAKKPG
jgi:hypothetical protein